MIMLCIAYIKPAVKKERLEGTWSFSMFDLNAATADLG